MYIHAHLLCIPAQIMSVLYVSHEKKTASEDDVQYSNAYCFTAEMKADNIL